MKPFKIHGTTVNGVLYLTETYATNSHWIALRECCDLGKVEGDAIWSRDVWWERILEPWKPLNLIELKKDKAIEHRGLKAVSYWSPGGVRVALDARYARAFRLKSVWVDKGHPTLVANTPHWEVLVAPLQ